MKKLFLFFTLVALCGAGCVANKVAPPTQNAVGQVASTYKNRDYGFELTVPKEFWSYQVSVQKINPHDEPWPLPAAFIYFYIPKDMPASWVRQHVSQDDFARLTNFMTVSVIKKTDWYAEENLFDCSQNNPQRAPGCMDQTSCNKKNLSADPECYIKDGVFGLDNKKSQYVYTVAVGDYDKSLKDAVNSSFKLAD